MKGRVTLLLEDHRVDRRQAPILPCLVERIRGRADRCSGRDELLVRPCLGAVGIDADGEVAIESQRQSGLAPGHRSRSKLPVGLPLQVLKEFDTVVMCAREFGDLR